MKKHGKAIGYAVLFLAIIGLSFTFTGCAGSVNGQVYIDENGNGIYDTSDMAVPYAKITLTRDDEKVAERYTDVNGFFDIGIKRVPGRICVLTDLSFAQANFNYLQQQFDKDAGMAAMTIAPLKIKAVTTTEEEEEEAEEEEVTVETTETELGPQGWVGDKYCKDIKAKGFEVDIPVNMDYEQAISAMPKRLEVTCYAGAECQIIIPFPEGCHLQTIYLPEGLSLASGNEKGISYDSSLNSISFDEDAGSTGPSAQKAATTKPAISVGDYRIVFIKLEVASDISLGTTEYKIEPSAKCADQTLSLQDIPLKLEREIDVAVYQDLKTTTELTSGKSGVKIAVTVENRGKSAVSYGDLTIKFEKPPDSAFQLGSLPAGCKNYFTSTTCRIDKIAPKSSETIIINITLPTLDSGVPPGETQEFISEVEFIAPGMDVTKESPQLTMEVKQP